MMMRSKTLFGMLLATVPLIPAMVVAADASSDSLSQPIRVPTAQSLLLGVYWAGEFTFQECKDPAVRWQKIDAALDGLRAHHVNAVWLTHLSSAETAEFARRAAKRGIGVVASLGELAGEVDHIRKSDHKSLIQRTLRAWSDAPKPIVWGLGDEPRTSYMEEMAAFVRAWRTHAPKEPVTTVVMWDDLEAAGRLGFDALSLDLYPFFSARNPSGFGIPPYAAWLQHTRRLVARSPRPWMMGQTFQETRGPFELDEKGNIVYLAGGAPHWVMPSPAEVRWQALTAFALGAKGMFCFHYRALVRPQVDAAPADLPAAVKHKTNSQSPTALVYADGRPTPQYEAVGEAFAWLARMAPILAPLKPAGAAEAWETTPVDAGGNVVEVLSHPVTAKQYLMVVAGYAGPENRPIRITLGPHIIGLRSVATGRRAAIEVAPPFRQAQVDLPPGTAELFECDVEPGNLPSTYADDFVTEKFRTDAVAFQNVGRHVGKSTVFSAADGESGPHQAFVVYDLDKLLAPLPAGGIRILTYEGGATPPDTRGAFWSVSRDGETYTPLSRNAFGTPIRFDGRYLKVGLSWRQASNARYGYLSRFGVAQWARPTGT